MFIICPQCNPVKSVLSNKTEKYIFLHFIPFSWKYEVVSYNLIRKLVYSVAGILELLPFNEPVKIKKS